MANTDNSGKIPGFHISEQTLEEKIQQYKDMVKAGEVELPFWTDFREFLGIRQDVLDEVMEPICGMEMPFYYRANRCCLKEAFF